MNIRGKQPPAGDERAEGTGGGTRPGAASLAVSPPFPSCTPRSAVPASATPALAASAGRPGNVTTATDDLVRGQERRYNAPLLTPGTRLLLPAGVKAVPVLDYYHRPRLARPRPPGRT